MVHTAVVISEPLQPEVAIEVVKQYREESQGLKHEQDFMLKQKYGLVAPQLTGAEINIIRKEEKNGR